MKHEAYTPYKYEGGGWAFVMPAAKGSAIDKKGFSGVVVSGYKTKKLCQQYADWWREMNS
jgi:hypothetical protein